VQGVQVPYYRQNTRHASSKSILIIAFVTIEEALRTLTFRWVKSILVRTDDAGIWIATLVTIWRTVGRSCHGRIQILDELIVDSIIKAANLITVLAKCGIGA
jgi:hypothetical protein